VIKYMCTLSRNTGFFCSGSEHGTRSVAGSNNGIISLGSVHTAACAFAGKGFERT
jgi:hypothetical protein